MKNWGKKNLNVVDPEGFVSGCESYIIGRSEYGRYPRTRPSR
jgi:hypothetical protein